MKFPCRGCREKTGLHSCRHHCQPYIEYQAEQKAARETRKKERQAEWFLRDVRSNGIINQRRLSSMGVNRLYKHNDHI